jgi:hypothetical protein
MLRYLGQGRITLPLSASLFVIADSFMPAKKKIAHDRKRVEGNPFL